MDSFDPSSNPAGVQRILSLLHPALPLSLPLYRRIQFAHFTPTSRLLVSRQETTDTDEPWLACFTDPDRGPETQLFVYGSWETAGCEDLPTDPRVRQLLARLLAHIRDEGLFEPALRTERVQAQLAAAGGPDYDAGADARQMVLCGSVHATTALALADLGVMELRSGEGEDGMPERYNKWIFDLRGTDGGEEKLPKGLRWGALSAKHYALVRSRTAIQRQDRTLRMLPDVSIFPTNSKDDFPVAWMFLGVDSSLTTLHVEPEYRGKGLAKALARKAWREHLDYYTSKHEGAGTSQKERWGHADVATYNTSSNAVCRSLGGTTLWRDYWMSIDLTKLVEHEQ